MASKLVELNDVQKKLILCLIDYQESYEGWHTYSKDSGVYEKTSEDEYRIKRKHSKNPEISFDSIHNKTLWNYTQQNFTNHKHDLISSGIIKERKFKFYDKRNRKSSDGKLQVKLNSTYEASKLALHCLFTSEGLTKKSKAHSSKEILDQTFTILENSTWIAKSQGAKKVFLKFSELLNYSSDEIEESIPLSFISLENEFETLSKSITDKFSFGLVLFALNFHHLFRIFLKDEKRFEKHISFYTKVLIPSMVMLPSHQANLILNSKTDFHLKETERKVNKKKKITRELGFSRNSENVTDKVIHPYIYEKAKTEISFGILCLLNSWTSDVLGGESTISHRSKKRGTLNFDMTQEMGKLSILSGLTYQNIGNILEGDYPIKNKRLKDDLQPKDKGSAPSKTEAPDGI